MYSFGRQELQFCRKFTWQCIALVARSHFYCIFTWSFMARALQITVREAILLHFYVVFYGSGSWAIFVQAWKADFVAI